MCRGCAWPPAPHYGTPPSVQVGYTDSATPRKAYDLTDTDVPLGSWRNEKGVKHTARVYATFDLSSFAGRDVSAGTLHIEERTAADCTRRAIQVWETDPVTTTPTWRNAPAQRRLLADMRTVSVCPGILSFDVSAAVTNADGTVTFELRVPAELEADVAYGRTLRWYTGVSLTLTYNSAPTTGTLRQGGFSCDDDTRRLAAWPGTLQAVAADADENDAWNTDVEFAVWPRDDPAARLTLTDENASTTTAGTVTLPTGYLADGQAYSWQARASDGVADTAAPPAPVVSATDDAVFTFSGNGDPDVAGFYYTWDEVSVPGCTSGDFRLYECPEPFSGQNQVRADAPGGSATLTLPPPGGWGTLKVAAIDEAGRRSPVVRYEFDPNG